MTKEVISSQLMKGGAGAVDQLPKIVRELAGYRVSYVAGATNGTKMNVAALRLEDTLLAVIIGTDTGGAWTDDVANCTIQTTKATGTLTVATVINGSTCTVGKTSYTFRTTPTIYSATAVDLPILGTNDLNAAALCNAINAIESRYDGTKARTPNVVATVANAVVTVTAVADGLGNAPVISGTVTVLAATNSGTATATLTCATVINTNTFVINGVTFTVKTAPVAGVLTDVAIAAANDNTLQAAIIATAINQYQLAYGTLGVLATPVAAAVNITALGGEPSGNTTVLTGTVTVLAASGSGTLAGGTATGGFKSSSNLSGKSVVVHWLNKDNGVAH
jgi:hypothetical protein